MTTFTKLLSILTFIVGILNSSFIMAAEEKEKEKTDKTENIRDGAYLDVGIGLTYQSDPFIFDNEGDSGLDIFINARYQKYGFFVEFPHGTSEQQNTVLSIGYNFLNTEHWSYDLRGAMNHRDVEYKMPKLNIVSTRVSHSKLGLRILGDYESTHVKLIVAGSSGAKGLYAGGWLSQNYQYNNWNFYSTVGIEYRNEDVVNYFYGVGEGEGEFPGSNEIDGLPSYQGESGLEYTGQVGFDYPITTDWVFEGFARGTFLPSGITDSPLVDGNAVIEAAILVKYVF
ncbi:MipA/OmpV family protein [Colwellia psychrerythraea]|uniref:MltA-interacting MipA family protein n=1 Tax=Colwellia psychrerythraea TaxID=28229 RepID=A0A099KDW9_COLPS|nr:MipA/OmpV family protein [Colwellia psychrerythraea]KGJ88207.1 MltA-interacting MipA family protein [Colwellia psychrerythraea]